MIIVVDKINVFIAIGSIMVNICFGKNVGYMNVG